MKKTSSNLICIAFVIVTLLAFISNDWILIKKDNYHILFPGNPTKDSVNSETKIGKVTVFSFIYESPENTTDSNLLYGLTAMDYPPMFIKIDNPEFLRGFFDGLVNGGVKEVNGTFIEGKDISYKNNPGREIKVDHDKGTAIVTMRFYIVKDKVFSLQTIAFPGMDRNANSTKFFDSFEVE
jgi:hypothetical protein